MSVGSVRIAVLQTLALPRRYHENRARAEVLVREVATRGAQIAVMPEMFLHGHFYEPDRHEHSEALEGPTLAWMKDLSRELGLMLMGGICESIDGDERCYSTSMLVDEGSLVGIYRKRRPASAELLFLRAGTGPSVFETRFGRVGMMICFDMSFPSSGVEAMEGAADLLLVSNAWLDMAKFPFLADQSFEHQRVLPRALAMQLRAPVAVSNLVGPLGMLVPGLPAFGGGVFPFDTEFTGCSMIIDHMGVVLAERPREQGEGSVTADVNTFMAKATREVALNDIGLESMRHHVFGSSNRGGSSA